MRSNPRRLYATSLAIVALLLVGLLPMPASAAPAVTTISPTSSTTNGGVLVTLSGSGFESGTTVTFGGTTASITTPCTPVAPAPECIAVIAPPRATSGAANVVVTNPSDGTSTQFTNGFTYTTSTAPSISGVTPSASSANGGTSVTISGSGFFFSDVTGAESATFRVGGHIPSNVVRGTCAAAIANTFVCTTATMDLPAHTVGAKDVVVTNPDTKAATRSNGFTYDDPIDATVTSASPASGAGTGGETVTIGGTGFVAGSVVRFGDNVATVTALGPTSISVTTPVHPGGTVDISVTSPSGEVAKGTGLFTYVPGGAPTINALNAGGVSPATGPSSGGSRVTITGTNIHAGVQVTFDGLPATVMATTATTATVIAPPHDAGKVPVRVTNPDGRTAVRADAFEYVQAIRISTLATSSLEGSRNGGNSVTIHGEGFVSGAKVFFNNVEAIGSSGSGASLTATVPAWDGGLFPSEPTGPVGETCYLTTTGGNPATNCDQVNVRVVNPDGSSATLVNGYAYKQATGPAITASPNGVCTTPSGACTAAASGTKNGGNTIFIRGTNFHTNPKPTVTFDDREGTVGAVTSTSIQVTVPPRPGTPAAVDVEVTNAGGQGVTIASSYTYTTASLPTAGATATPASGSQNGGTSAVIAGSNFHTSPRAIVTMGGATTFTANVATDSIQATGHGLANGRTVRVSSADTLPEPLLANTDYFVRNSEPNRFQVSATSTGQIIDLTTAGTGPHSLIAPLQTSAFSATSITVSTPPRSTSGEALLRVTNPGGDEVATLFTYTASTAPTITAISPGSGSVAGGTSVTITGTNFHTDPKPRVTFGGVAGLVGTVSATSLQVTAPAGTGLGPVDVVVTNPSGQSATRLATAPDPFSYSAATGSPTPTAVSPASGPEGTTVTVTGTNFALPGPERSAPEPAISIGTTTLPADNVRVLGATSIEIVTPPGLADGTHPISITNPGGGSGALGSAFTVPATAGPAPTMGANPTITCGTTNGGTVTVAGTGFNVGGALLFDSVPGRLTAAPVTPFTSATAEVPAAADAGRRTVTFVNQDGQSAGLFRGCPVTADQPPRIDSWSPTAGPATGGTVVTILGANFATGLRVSADAFPGQVLSRTDTQITVRLGPHTAGIADLIVTNPDTKSATADDAFGFVGAGGPPAATVTSVSPNTGTSLGGTSVTITGTGFATGATVTFGGTAATGAVVATATSITATTPAHAAGQVDVVVTNPGAAAGTLANGFTYTAAAAPTLVSLSPTVGSTNGGTSVTLTGTNFVNSATVTFGGTAATSVTFNSATSLTAVTPARTVAGAVSVVVTNPDAQTATLTSGFTYQAAAAPTVTATLSPSTGPSVGGTSVTITGTNFVDGATVTFGGNAATNVAVATGGTSLSLTTPGHPAGAVSVVVRNPDGQTATVTNAFTYSASPAPTISDVTPNSGPSTGDTAITITGTGFAAGATVTVGGNAATSVTVNSATQITARTPAGTAGAKAVVVTNPDDQAATRANAFTYGSSGGPSATQIEAANERLQDSVEVERDDGDNVITFSIAGITPEPAGIDVWRSTSPFEKITTLEGAAAESGTFTDIDAPAGAHYILTVWYTRDVAGGFVSSLDEAPGYVGLSEDELRDFAASPAAAGGSPLVWILVALGVLVLVAIIIVVIVVSRRKGQEREARDEWPPVHTDHPPAGPSRTFNITCPRCDTKFEATGSKPLVTHCPNCGVEGVLR